ncbi:B-box zinc finger protein 32 [Senna tora]|uniref:B-box zinc finger protein 32 n=1 Tax=Senna tora TaxID=362788 RepID=A0A834SL27_9FABA|nr:B-box zinc finger protein 32 [Senna tora]
MEMFRVKTEVKEETEDHVKRERNSRKRRKILFSSRTLCAVSVGTRTGRNNNLDNGSPPRNKIPSCKILACIAEKASNVPEGQEISIMNPFVTISTQIRIISLAIQRSLHFTELTTH